MRKPGLTFRIYGTLTAFLLYAVLQIGYGLMEIRTTKANTGAKNKVRASNAFIHSSLEYKPEFPSIFFSAYIK